MDIVFIGAGNLATHLSQALQKSGEHRIIQVFSRTKESASTLADKLGCPWTTDISDVTSKGELYIFSVRDAVLSDLAEKLYLHLREIAEPGKKDRGASALFIHTAGSMSMDMLPMLRRGVFYPMQTFSKSRELNFSKIPIFIESKTDRDFLLDLAKSISSQVYELDGENRRYLHLAAVFACNFSNHMYDLSARILQQHNIPFSVMLPLIDETAQKVHDMNPGQAQTGPAVRFDENVMNEHLNLLQDIQMKEIYKLLSNSIHDKLRSDKN